MDYSFQGRYPPAQLAVTAASFNNRTDPTWHANSGATYHITSELNNLSVRSGYQGKEEVFEGNGQCLQIANTGSSFVHLPSSPSLKLSQILHVPDISSNLLYVNKLAKDNDCVFVFDSLGLSIQDQTSGGILFQGLSKNGLYPFPMSLTNTLTALLGVKSSAGIWHHRLGHPSSSIFQHVAHTSPFQGSVAIPFCEFRRLGKSYKLPFSFSESVSTFPLDIVHSDVWGPSHFLSVCGFRYYVVFIDASSKYAWLFPVHRKS